MRKYTLTLRPDSIKGKFITVVIRPEHYIPFAVTAALLAVAVAWLVLESPLPGYGELLALDRRAEHLAAENAVLAADLQRLRAGLDALEERIGLQLLLSEKINLLLGVDEDGGGGYPPAAADRGSELLYAIELLEMRLEMHDRFMEIIDHFPIRLPIRSDFEISSGFGPRLSPFTKQPEMHQGLDFSAPEGTVIYATGAGEVVLAGRRRDLREHRYARLGTIVQLRHGDTGFETIYGHCSEVFVKKGQRIEAGQPIAAVGDSGWSTAPHLHFAIRRGERYLDPRTYLLYFDVEMIRRQLLTKATD